MRILQLAPQVPYPLFDGGKVGIYNITKHLAERGHDVTLLAIDRAPGYDFAPLKQFCKLFTVPHSTSNSVSGVIMNLASPLPYNISKYRFKRYEIALRSLLHRGQYDVIHIDHLHMASYVGVCRAMASAPIVLREHNVESVIMERYLETVREPLLKAYLGVQLQRLRRYEAKMLGAVDVCCAITAADATRIRSMQPNAAVEVVPAGVDERYFTASSGNSPRPSSIAFFGGLDWIPNQDAVEWFVRCIYPLVKKKNVRAQLYIYGKDPSSAIRALENDSIHIMGFAEDLKSELQRCAVAIAPIRIGGGIRIKILECFAMGIPVVSTSIGVEGVEAEAGKHLMVENTAEGFAEAVLAVCEDEALRTRLAKEAYDLAHNRYRWTFVAEQLEVTYRAAMLRTPVGRRT